MSASPVNILIDTALKLITEGSLEIKSDDRLFFPPFPGFLCSFETSRVQEQDALSHTEENIISLLELCSRVSRNRRTGSGALKLTVNIWCLEHDATTSRGYRDRQ